MGFLVGYVLTILIAELLILSPFVAVQAVLSAPRRPWQHSVILPSVWLLAIAVWVVFSMLTAPLSLSWQSSWEGFAARTFLLSLPLFAMGVTTLFRRAKGRTALKIAAVALMLALLPLPMMQSDGGTTVYFAFLYRIELRHRIDDTRPSGFDQSTHVAVFPWNFQDDGGRS